jgi:hypothetical protein
LTTALHWLASVDTVRFAPQVIVQSVTVTVNEQLAVLPLASVAVQVTVVVPTLKQAPDGGAHRTVAPAQLSLPVGGV